LVEIALELLKTNTTILSNVTILFPNVQKFNMSMILSDKFIGKAFFIDEAYLYLDKRRSMSDINLIFSYLDWQSRKLQNDIYFCIQDESVLDERSKKMIDLKTYCSHLNGNFTQIYMNKWNQITQTIVIPESEASKLYPYFNTYELIKNERSNEFLAKYGNTENSNGVIDENMNSFIQFMKDYHKEKVSDKFIKFFFTQNQLPMNKTLLNDFFFKAEKKWCETFAKK
jgi:hypothetical protein